MFCSKRQPNKQNTMIIVQQQTITATTKKNNWSKSILNNLNIMCRPNVFQYIDGKG